jgi:hypothetical protein
MQLIYYKKEGDGFVTDAITDDGYIYSIYLRNMPAPKKITLKMLPPLPAGILYSFDQLKEQFLTCLPLCILPSI